MHELRALPHETTWLELKHNNADPGKIGENVSALANGALLADQPRGYLVWGIDDASHAVVGTTFDPETAKAKGNELIEGWLSHHLEPRLDLRFEAGVVDGHRVVVLSFEPPSSHPARFNGEAYVRVGSYTKKLKEHPEKERALWRKFERVSFENAAAIDGLDDDAVLGLLDYPAYFTLTHQPLPANKEALLAGLVADGVVAKPVGGRWSITNLGAVLFARRLEDFRHLGRKAMRVIVYKGGDRLSTVRELVEGRGYASGFEGLIAVINGLVPSNEVIAQALRRTVPMYPELAVRELVANALIHQDFEVRGAGPMVEIFEDRIEVSNPGRPLVDTRRFLDAPPRSRNEALASLMRRMGVCEERGSGVDKVVFQCELHQLPAPLFEVAGDGTRAVLFAHRAFAKMDQADRIRACYLHACLKWVSREYLTNASLRARFGIEERNKATVSRLIREAVDVGVIAPVDPGASRKLMRYQPAWAGASTG
ncbi:MAG: ATP-binding protein [Sandaracinus sp.]